MTAAIPLLLTPRGLFGGHRSRRLVERNILVYRRNWVFFVSGFFEPFFYLLSIGLGLNHLVGGVHVGTRIVPYVKFVAPGLLAAAAMNGAIFDSTFNIFFKLKIAHTYDTVLSTPLAPTDVALGELTWSLIRGGIYSVAFICAMSGLGYSTTPWVVLCLPAALLVSATFSAVGMAATTYMRSWQDFDMVSLAMIPMFLFSATFYPLTVYPGWLQTVVSVTPLYQGVALIRGLDLGTFNFAMLGHVAYLSLAASVGLIVTGRRLATLLLP